MVQVLDKGYVKYISHMGDDNSPLESARMSTGNETGTDIIKDDKLREYLWKNSHVSPFESCVLTIEMKLPLFVLRQIDRHRTLGIEETTIESYDTFRKYCSKNEFSGRYAEFGDEFYVPTKERLALQSKDNKQAQGREDTELDAAEYIVTGFESSYKESYNEYELLMKAGVSKELGRLVLSGAIYTKIRITASLLNWFNFLRLRLEEHAQWEVRQYAQAIADIIKEKWPKCYKLFEEYTLNPISFFSHELKALKQLIDEQICEHDKNSRAYFIYLLETGGLLKLKEAEKLADKLGIKDL